MTAKIVISLEGLPKTLIRIKEHRRLMLEAADEGLIEALEEFTLPLAQQLVPRDTELLAESTYVDRLGPLTAKLANSMFYAKWMEYGFYMTFDNIRAMAAQGILKPRVPPQRFVPHWVQRPFMIPAVEETLEDVENYIVEKTKAKFAELR
jgi:hypothetical protein